MRARYALPLVLGVGALTSSSVICIRAGMAVPEDVSLSAVQLHSRSIHGTRAGLHARVAESPAVRPDSSRRPESVLTTTIAATAGHADPVWRH
jgi:hypothetical protein